MNVCLAFSNLSMFITIGIKGNEGSKLYYAKLLLLSDLDLKVKKKISDLVQI